MTNRYERIRKARRALEVLRERYAREAEDCAMTDRYERIRAALAMGPTPGPWLICPTNSGTFVKSERVAGYLAEVRDCGSGDVGANARLIAAAPELLAALVELRDWYTEHTEIGRAHV